MIDSDLLVAIVVVFANESVRRYLRARKFVPKEAWTQFKATEDWRKENNLEELYDTIDVKEYDETRRLVRVKMWETLTELTLFPTVPAMDRQTR